MISYCIMNDNVVTNEYLASIHDNNYSNVCMRIYLSHDPDHKKPVWSLRYFVPQVLITGKMLNGYLIFSVKNIVQNVKLIELWGKKLAPLHFVISTS